MLGLLRSPSRSAAGAIGYVTVGILLIIWSGLWYYFFLRPDPNPPTWQTYVCVALICTGFAIAGIGLLFGLIGRGAKAADNTVGVASTGVAAAAPVAMTTPVATASPVLTSNQPVLIDAPGRPTPIPAAFQ